MKILIKNLILVGTILAASSANAALFCADTAGGGFVCGQVGSCAEVSPLGSGEYCYGIANPDLPDNATILSGSQASKFISSAQKLRLQAKPSLKSITTAPKVSGDGLDRIQESLD